MLEKDHRTLEHKGVDLNQMNSSFKKNIQYLRGIAALSVLLFHAGHWYSVAYGDAFYKNLFPGFYGLYGVAIFFAISGYLMADLAPKQKPFEFLFRRIVRIYPTFFIATVFALMVRPTVLQIYAPINLTLAPNETPTYPLGVEWSLVNEIFFYILIFFLSATVSAKYIIHFSVIWTSLILIVTFSGVSTPQIGFANVFQIAFMVENIPFSLGLLIPIITRLKISGLLYFSIFIIGCILSLKIDHLSVNRIVAGVSSVFLVAAAVQTAPILRGLTDVVFSKLGDWSYALYLTHVPLFRGVMPIDITPSFWIFSMWIASAIALSAILGEADMLISRHLRALSKYFSYLHIAVISTVFITIYISTSLYLFFR